MQVCRSLTLAEVRERVGYLRELGISHLYLSPLLAAAPGSTHGYDVVDHSRLNPEIGSEDDLRALAEALHAAEMGALVDLVPNHMCIAQPSNQLWYEVLENGEQAAATDFFDIDWGPPKAELAGKVLLPVLGDQFGRELEAGAVKVEFDRGSFHLLCGERRFPLAPNTWRFVIEPIWRRVKERAGDDAAPSVELESILRSLSHWPTDRSVTRARRHERAALVRRIAALVEDPKMQADFEAAVSTINGIVGEPRSFDALETLVSAQHYRLAHWRVAAHEINYRRFFDINDLAAIRVERDDVFSTVHALPFRWAEQGWVNGFRIDHVDGLLEPARYLTQIRQRVGGAPFTLFVEKILAAGESLPEGWTTDGTTGYDYLAAASAVLVDNENAARLRECWRDFTGLTDSYRDVVYESKRLILDTAMVAELTVLAKRLDALSEHHRYSRDFTLASLHEALREVIASFPVYRTYITREAAFATERDAQVIRTAIAEATRRNPVINRSVFAFLEDILLLHDPGGLDADQTLARRDFVLRFQQLTGPVTAKGVEDTAFYRFFPLASLAEVGGDPDRLGSSVDEFHVISRLRAHSSPRSMSATATHDTKRGEDLRARLHVLSELPDEWRSAVVRWRGLNAPHRVRMPTQEVPDLPTDYFIYQSLVGGWPIGGISARDESFRARFKAYIAKATAEAKVHTSWINPDTAYDQAIEVFIDAILDPQRSGEFLADLDRFVSIIAVPGFLNGLTQVLLKIAAPGIPDVYQGTETWDLSFADPDNRRPVDFAARAAALARVKRETAEDPGRAARTFLGEPRSGDVKTFVLTRALALRGERPAAFESPLYEGCAVHGALARHVIAFARGEPGRRVIAVAGRLYARLTARGTVASTASALATSTEAAIGAAWGDTAVQLATPLTGARYREALTDRALTLETVNGGAGFRLHDVFACLPVALVEEMS